MFCVTSSPSSIPLNIVTSLIYKNKLKVVRKDKAENPNKTLTKS